MFNMRFKYNTIKNVNSPIMRRLSQWRTTIVEASSGSLFETVLLLVSIKISTQVHNLVKIFSRKNLNLKLN